MAIFLSSAKAKARRPTYLEMSFLNETMLCQKCIPHSLIGFKKFKIKALVPQPNYAYVSCIFVFHLKWLVLLSINLLLHRIRQTIRKSSPSVFTNGIIVNVAHTAP